MMWLPADCLECSGFRRAHASVIGGKGVFSSLNTTLRIRCRLAGIKEFGQRHGLGRSPVTAASDRALAGLGFCVSDEHGNIRLVHAWQTDRAYARGWRTFVPSEPRTHVRGHGRWSGDGQKMEPDKRPSG